MKPNPLIRAVAWATIALALTACDASKYIDLVPDPRTAQQLAVEHDDPDKALAEKVKTALGLETGQGAYGVEVTASNGTVQLWGVLDSTAVRKRFEVITAGVVGVRAVDNRLQVDPGA